jgi:hypothetical protein
MQKSVSQKSAFTLSATSPYPEWMDARGGNPNDESDSDDVQNGGKRMKGAGKGVDFIVMLSKIAKALKEEDPELKDGTALKSVLSKILNGADRNLDNAIAEAKKLLKSKELHKRIAQRQAEISKKAAEKKAAKGKMERVKKTSTKETKKPSIKGGKKASKKVSKKASKKASKKSSAKGKKH